MSQERIKELRALLTQLNELEGRVSTLQKSISVLQTNLQACSPQATEGTNLQGNVGAANLVRKGGRSGKASSPTSVQG